MIRIFPRSLVTGAALLGVGVLVLLGSRVFGLTAMLAAVLALCLVVPLVDAAFRHQRFVAGLLCTIAVLMPGAGYAFGAPAVVQYVVDLIVVVFVVTCLVSRWRRGLKIVFDWPIVAFFAVLVVILLVTGGFALVGIQTIWSLMLGPILVIAIGNSTLGPKDARPLIRVLVTLVAFQLVVQLIERGVLHVQSVDRMGGTLGRAGTTQLGVLMACFWVAVVAYVTATRRWRAALWLALPLASMAIAEAKAGFLLSSIGTLFVAGLWLLKRRYRRFLWALAAVVLPIALVFVLLRYFPVYIFGSESAGDYWLRAFDPRAQLDYLQGYAAGGQAGRLSALLLAWETISTQGAVPFGVGLGTLSTTGFVGGDLPDSGWLIETMAWTPSSGRMLLEAGLVGICALCLLLVAQALPGWRQLGSRDGFRAFLGATLVGVVPVFVIGGFYTTSWTFRALSIPFWLYVGLVRLQEKRQPQVADSAKPALAPGAAARSPMTAAGSPAWRSRRKPARGR